MTPVTFTGLSINGKIRGKKGEIKSPEKAEYFKAYKNKKERNMQATHAIREPNILKFEWFHEKKKNFPYYY